MSGLGWIGVELLGQMAGYPNTGPLKIPGFVHLHTAGMGTKPDNLCASVLKVYVETVDWQTVEGGKRY